MQSEVARTQAYQLIADYEYWRDKVDMLGAQLGTDNELYLLAVVDLLAKRQELAKYLALGMAK